MIFSITFESTNSRIDCPSLNLHLVGTPHVNGTLASEELSGNRVVTFQIRASSTNCVLGSMLAMNLRVIYAPNGYSCRSFGYTVLGDQSLPYNEQRHDWVECGKWYWHISGNDVIALNELMAEQIKAHPRDRSLALELELDGIVAVRTTQDAAQQSGFCPAHFSVRCPLRIPASDWAAIAETIDLLPTSLDLPKGRAFPDEPTWRSTLHDMSDARMQMSKGEAADSIHRCYDIVARLLEQRITARSPRVYSRNDWKQFFEATEPPEDANRPTRTKALIDLFFGLGQLSNIMGHHAGQTSPGDRQPMEPWEAELFLWMEHFAVGYLSRYPKRP